MPSWSVKYSPDCRTETACRLTSVCTLLWPGRTIETVRNGFPTSGRGNAEARATAEARTRVICGAINQVGTSWMYKVTRQVANYILLTSKQKFHGGTYIFIKVQPSYEQ